MTSAGRRTQVAYDLITAGIGNHARDVRTAMETRTLMALLMNSSNQPSLVNPSHYRTAMFSCLPIFARIVAAS